MSGYEKKDQETEADKKMKLYTKQISEATGMPAEQIEQEVRHLIEESLKAIREREAITSAKSAQEVDPDKVLLSEIERSGEEGIMLSKIKRNLRNFLEPLGQQGLIVRGRKKRN